MKHYEGASVRPQALVLSPEKPYPARGGGALRSASLIDYLARRYNMDVITFSEQNSAACSFPEDRVRDTLVLDLPRHSRTPSARAFRNVRRFVTGRPPLVDRFAGFEHTVAEWVDERVYSMAVIEHFWCAPYAAKLRDRTQRLVLDLHNVESALQESTATAEHWPLSMMFRRFAARYRDLEREWLPQFDDVLVASKDDAGRIAGLAPAARVIVYPNNLPTFDQPAVSEDEAIGFSGNLEYHPNQKAIQWFAAEIWPGVRRSHPGLEWRLVGMNPESVRVTAPGMSVAGPVEDAVVALAAMKVVVVPLLSGSGTRFKILEAWAAGRAVVSTTLGAEGLGAVHGEHLLIADDAASFVTAIQKLLGDAALRMRLGASGRRLYLGCFTREVGWQALESAGF